MREYLWIDLDDTTWKITSDNPNILWAKHIEGDLTLESEFVIKSPEAIITLAPNIKTIISQYTKDKLHIITAGMSLLFPYENQPCIKLLKLFGIYDSFSRVILGSCNMRKENMIYLPSRSTIIDDNHMVRKDCERYDIETIDPETILWNVTS